MKLKWGASGFLIIIWAYCFQLHAHEVDFGPDSFEVTKAKAGKGDARAQFYLGTYYYCNRGDKQDQLQDFLDAAKWFRKAADQGNAMAESCLGYCYSIGRGVTQDDAEGDKWYRKAGDQGNIIAQLNLGNNYAHGLGVSQDYAEAAKWYRKAADQGDAIAQYSLGNCYAKGQGVTQDYSEAIKWFRKAADQGDVMAQYSLGFDYANGQGVTQNDAEAVKWNRKAAEQGFAPAQSCIGYNYEKGLGVTQNYAEAVKWYRKAADQGNAGAQCNLGFDYTIGRGVTQDDAEAVKWYRKAAGQKFAMAEFNLGTSYERGEGVTQDYMEAVKWYRKAADQGYAAAQFNLGCCYGKGTGVTQNDLEGYIWSSIAAAHGITNAFKNRDIFSDRLNHEEITEGQRRAAAFVPHIEIDGQQSLEKPNAVEAVRPTFTGTGFFITDDGYLITSYHVVKGANKVRLLTGAGLIDATVMKVDAANDLALLKVTGNFATLPVAMSRSVKLGATVATVGFPDTGLQGFSPKLAKGDIASLAGNQDDPRYFQISLPVQHGNSGGALVDARGNVVGIVAARLGVEIGKAVTSDELPENVNYAIKSSLLLSFLESVPDVSARLKDPNTKDEPFEDVVKSAQDAAVLVLVY